ncbi:MAG: hypothetical protein LCH60_12885 [Actinobacteria bacterium]|jgi:hypothetical protein|nr:hypothetical protein [Actinomycetota bacterium]MCA0323436.1 hypothetical protein [Actinomycetota bacterium]
MTPRLRAVLAATISAISFAAIAPAASASSQPDPTQIAAVLPAEQSAAFKQLAQSQQELTAQILADPDFAVPGREQALTAKYRQVAVTKTASDSTNRSLAASGSRSSWVSQNWTILGITYAKVTTTVGYFYNGSSATAIDYCVGNAVNYVPLRTINYYPTTSVNSDGTVTCRTNWTLDRPLQSTAYGVQGLRVNGNGTIVRTWYL